MSVKFFRESEKQIFLHFLNREAYQACGGYIDKGCAANILEVLTLSHCSKMSVNISQLLEFSDDGKDFLKEIFFLINNNIINLQSQSSSASEFIASRQSLYEHDKDRYPMYFSDNVYFTENFIISDVNRTSTTTLLQKNILDLNPGPLFQSATGPISQQDWNAIFPKFEDVQSITASNRSKAVTKSLYKIHSKSAGFNLQHIEVLGRLVSGLYIKNYKSKGRYATCTSVPGLSYYDQYDDFPFYDIDIVLHLLKILRYDYLKVKIGRELRDQRIELYNQFPHNQFVASFNVFIGSIYRMIVSQGQDCDNKSSLKMRIMNVAVDATRAMAEFAGFSGLEEFYNKSCSQIERMSAYLSQRDPNFRDAWRSYMMPDIPGSKILFLTATDIEDEKLIAELERIGVREGPPKKVKNNFVRNFSSKIPVQVYLVRSSAGSSGSNGSTLVAGEAIDALKPDYIISVGICFGADKEKQKIGDVLVSRNIYHYEPGRISEKDFVPRGEKLPASSYLLQLCQATKLESANRHIGLIASGEKLVDSEDFVRFLHDQQKEFIGGEMEGSGISAAAQRHKADWIMIKAICDWGFKKNKKGQPTAAENAARYACKVLETLAKTGGEDS